ncbi:hypothetical protein H9P43_000991 [Blastocladiella emersonii ATCC 22665]|nr:hypothetical protein H9P43_000991 [Blastocladiella emersonii ATCC 22665]
MTLLSAVLEAALIAAVTLDGSVTVVAGNGAASASRAAPSIRPPPKRYLAVFDLNGCLLARLHEVEYAAAQQLHHPLPHSCGIVGFKHTFRRPLFELFWAVLSTNPDVDVAVWTSATSYNAEQLILAVLGKEFASRLRFVWAREKCTSDQSDSVDTWATLKDLSKVFAAFPEYGPERTIIVDDSLRKSRLNPANALVIPQWGLCDAARPPMDDTALRRLTFYFEYLSHARPDDVREWMRMYPFSVPQVVTGAESPPAAGHSSQVQFVVNTAANFAAPPESEQ